MCTALIPGELHLVVRLVQRLSRRSCEIGDRDTLTHDVSEQSHKSTPNHLSLFVFMQVEASMRKRLRSVRENWTRLMKQSQAVMGMYRTCLVIITRSPRGGACCVLIVVGDDPKPRVPKDPLSTSRSTAISHITPGVRNNPSPPSLNAHIRPRGSSSD